MASCLRNFIRLQNIFTSKLLNRDQFVSLKFPNSRLYGTGAKSRIFSKAAVIVGGLGVTGGVYGYLAAPTRKDRVEGVPVSEKSDYIIRHEIPDIKPSREVQPNFLFQNKLNFLHYKNVGEKCVFLNIQNKICFSIGL